MKDERRTQNRMLCADMLDVRWRDRAGKQFKATALLEDISSAGACLQTEAPLPIGAEIGWDSPKQFFSGYVRYCVYREIGYFVGVQFGESTQWSKAKFLPQHLLDPQKLITKPRAAKPAVAKPAVAKLKATAPTTLRGENRGSSGRSLPA